MEFITTKKDPTDTHIFGFHLSLLIEYVESDIYFCMANKIVADIFISYLAYHHITKASPLDITALMRSEGDRVEPTPQAD